MLRFCQVARSVNGSSSEGSFLFSPLWQLSAILPWRNLCHRFYAWHSLRVYSSGFAPLDNLRSDSTAGGCCGAGRDYRRPGSGEWSPGEIHHQSPCPWVAQYPLPAGQRYTSKCQRQRSHRHHTLFSLSWDSSSNAYENPGINPPAASSVLHGQHSVSGDIPHPIRNCGTFPEKRN